MSFEFAKSNEKKRLEAEQKELEQKINTALKEIMVWPGSKDEFEDYIGYKTEWVPMEDNIKGITYVERNKDDPFCFYNLDFKKQIMDEGVVALVSANLSYSQAYASPDQWMYFGIPVKKK